MIIADNTNHEEDFNIEMNLLSGLNIGDSVDVSTYGIVKSGKISALNQKFIQLDLDKRNHCTKAVQWFLLLLYRP